MYLKQPSMQVFREKSRIIEISVEKSREMDSVGEKRVHIDPVSAYLPLDDCEQDDY